MKRFFAAFLALIMVLSLCACGISSSRLPVDSEDDLDVYLLLMDLERLYSYDAHTDTLTLLLDEFVSAYDREGNLVVASTTDGDIYYINLESGESTLAYEEGSAISRIHVYEQGFTAQFFSMTGGTTAKRYLFRNKETQEIPIDESAWETALIDEVFYYSAYEESSDSFWLYGVDLSKKVIGDPVAIYESSEYLNVSSYNDDLFLQQGEECWQEFDADTKTTKPLPYAVNDLYFTNYMDDNFALCTIYDYSGEISSTTYYLENEDGEFCLDIPGLDPYVQVHSVVDDLALCEVSDYHDEEDSYYTSYQWYFLNTKSGALEPLQLLSQTQQLFASGDFPVMDSSTARKPVTQMIYGLFCSSPGIEGAKPLCSTTHGAWLNIADGGCDIALLAAPTEEEEAYLAQKGVEVEMKLYGGDGLVFIGNKECGVENLTLDQVRDIYDGKITNWSELGGVDHTITVLYRDDQSGSQRLFERMVYNDENLPNYNGNRFALMDEMSTIVNSCLYDPYAIGYSIMTYLNDVYGEEDLLAFSLEGITPETAHVADGSYPLSTQGYVVIRSDESADSPARRLYDWFGSAASDYVLNSCSVTPIHEN